MGDSCYILCKGLPVRPTTDRAKEGLFNILENRIHWEGKHVLDLCCGTGNMTFEFASRVYRGFSQLTNIKDVHPTSRSRLQHGMQLKSD
jgi:16S rRNA G966 N2-methylase RsmD